MLTRRAPTNILVCTIALWVIAGFLPVQKSYAASKAGPAYHQEESPAGQGVSTGREQTVTMQAAGDPDEYAHSDDGTPTSGTGHKSIIAIVFEMIATWFSLVWGLPPL